MSTPPRHPTHPTRAWYLLLLLPLIGTLWVPWYNRATPTLLGLPFFIVYLLAWVPLSALLSGIVYWRTRRLH